MCVCTVAHQVEITLLTGISFFFYCYTLFWSIKFWEDIQFIHQTEIISWEEIQYFIPMQHTCFLHTFFCGASETLNMLDESVLHHGILRSCHSFSVGNVSEVWNFASAPRIHLEAWFNGLCWGTGEKTETKSMFLIQLFLHSLLSVA